MTIAFLITYVWAAVTTWILVFVMADERQTKISLTAHVTYVALSLVWWLLPFFIFGPVLRDLWADRRAKQVSP